MTDEQKKQRDDMAAVYSKVFLGSLEGLRVLADLRTKFGVDRSVFRRVNGQYNALEAALNEGERRVMADIEAALKLAAPHAWAESFIPSNPIP
jgi:hypothetical protein